MLIISKIERVGGTRVSLDGAEYLFEEREAGGPHICDVENDAHAKRLLSIPEGFAAADGSIPMRAVAADTETTFLLTPVDEPQPDDTAPEGDGIESVDDESDDVQDTAPEDDGLDDYDEGSLAQAYRDEFMQKPHHKMKSDRIIREIREARAARAN
jgi:hypothetical protein